MSATHVLVDNHYSLNSPDPASLSPSSSSPSRSRRLSLSPRSARRVSSQPAFPSPNSLAPPLPTRPPLPPFPAHVLSTPDPGEAVQPARRSVQIGSGGPVNWSRPFPKTHTPPPTSFPGANNSPSRSNAPARSPTSPSRQRTMSANLALRSPYRGAAASPASSADDDEIPTTPTFLPPGAASPQHPPPPTSQRSWAVVSDCKGLGMAGIAELDPDPMSPVGEDVPCIAPSSCSSSEAEGSLGGDSVNTASSNLSVPTTPTRLQFVSETLVPLSNPATLDELRSLRAKAAELDMESKRLRRLKGREPAASPRLVPRKKVPVVTAIELQEVPKPRRPAVRHSLISHSPSTDQTFAFLADPLPVFPSGLGRSLAPADASRRPFYAQGKAALSVIEFSSKPQHDAPAYAAPRSRHVSSVVPSFASLKREKSERVQYQQPVHLPPIPAYAPAHPSLLPGATTTTTPTPSPALSQATPQRSPPLQNMPFGENNSSNVNVKPGFLNKHKKLSRFLGKAQVA